MRFRIEHSSSRCPSRRLSGAFAARAVSLAILLACCAAPALAREEAGVDVDERAVVDGVELRLNGAGVRSRFFIKIYVAALYVRRPSQEAATLIGDDGPKRVWMHFLHDVDAPKLQAAWKEGFASNSDALQVESLGDRIDRFSGLFGDAATGDVAILDYVPGTGTKVSVNGAELGIVEGRDFNEALMRVWLGTSPVDEDLKSGLLGD